MPKYNIGQRLRVGQTGDETFNRDWIDREVTVYSMDTGVGCGASAESPFYHVHDDAGNKESFWTEELEENNNA